jgi:hypothetical protein
MAGDRPHDQEDTRRNDGEEDQSEIAEARVKEAVCKRGERSPHRRDALVNHKEFNFEYRRSGELSKESGVAKIPLKKWRVDHWMQNDRAPFRQRKQHWKFNSRVKFWMKVEVYDVQYRAEIGDQEIARIVVTVLIGND